MSSLKAKCPKCSCTSITYTRKGQAIGNKVIKNGNKGLYYSFLELFMIGLGLGGIIDLLGWNKNNKLIITCLNCGFSWRLNNN
ncbi:MAG: hypothetical protein U0457_12670 [Candidatus Sericytochromatia bacterium]